MYDNFYELPKDLPVPVDDGNTDHLLGMQVPSIAMMSTANRMVNLADVSERQRTVVYCYSLAGAPDKELPAGWNEIPGARGCTPQSCAFRDHFSELQALQTQVFGLSTQTTEYQREFAQRVHLPYELLSDSKLAFAKTLRLPTFEVDSMSSSKEPPLFFQNAGSLKSSTLFFHPTRMLKK
ncbi:MAG: redoxin domain-containing protein [Pyrinomonadaceae bacterium]